MVLVLMARYGGLGGWRPPARAVRAMTPFNHVVTSAEELRQLVGTPASRSVLKERKELDHHDRAFIALSPFVLLATAGEGGRCDVSPKGDAPGFVTCSTRDGW